MGLDRTFVSLPSATGVQNGAGYHPAQGVYYAQTSSRPRVAAIASHYSVDFSEHYLAERMARLGIGFLGWNTRYRNDETFFRLEHALVDVAAGVRWLREHERVTTVVLLGNCGGGSLLAAYQAQAEAPFSVLAEKPGPLGDALASLEPGDLYISLQAHLGRPEVLTNSLDPTVSDESDPLSGLGATDLDMFDPSNGPPYSEAFLSRYRAEQQERNRRITAWARERIRVLKDAGAYEQVFTVHRAWADPRFVDPGIDPSERPRNLCLGGEPRAANMSGYSIASTCSLRTWLSLWDMDASPCRGEANLRHVSSPALVVQSRADCAVFPSDAAAILEALGAADKALEMIDGDHYLEQPSSARDDTAELLAGWILGHSA